MNMEEIITRAENNIRNALIDYGKHTSQHDVLEHVSETFIHQLAYDSSYAKRDLRRLFSKSPAWHPELDAIVINGTRTNDPNYKRAYNIETNILSAKLEELMEKNSAEWEDLQSAMCWFVEPDAASEDVDYYLRAMNRIAPRAYKPGRKPSRVFKAMCQELGIADESAGSQFQRLYAQFADELNAKKIDFKLFVSINPAHFLTMSNPKSDDRGDTLTSCHSLNSMEYNYNNGCTGYARDDVSFIVFTVDDPTNPELLNNRKTTRQIFAYRPGSGLLLQSRMYNTSGGVYGAAKESTLYRDLIQREISDLEGAVNLWKTGDSYDEYSEFVEADCEFGGYPDWIYDNFDGHVSIRKDAENNVEPLIIGTSGLCVVCGEEISSGVYCDDCKPKRYRCAHCGDGCDDVYLVQNRHGDYIEVCELCRDRYYTQCDCCGEFVHNDDITVVDGRNVCSSCYSGLVTTCHICGEEHFRYDMWRVVHEGERVYVCNGCSEEHLIHCPECGTRLMASDDSCWCCERNLREDVPA